MDEKMRKKIDEKGAAIKEVIADEISRVMRQDKIRSYTLLEGCGITYPTYAKVVQGKTYNIDSLVALLAYLDIELSIKRKK